MRVVSFVVSACLAVGSQSARPGQSPQDIVDRAEAHFAAGRLAESVAEYDRLAALVPSLAPTLWQRGIALYYLGQFDACATQFASYFAEDRTDLENASWHLLCVARGQSIARARESALAAGPDRRIMRTQIYAMLRGRITTDELIVAASEIVTAQFYAFLYSGLYLDAIGNTAGALPYLEAAASDKYRDEGGFMNVVARLALARARRGR
jgi:lipoprotein NlpI